MERDDSREPFGFEMIVILGSTRGPSAVNKFAVTTLKCILTPLFITVDIFALVDQYLFDG